jgi:hypothetical protein
MRSVLFIRAVRHETFRVHVPLSILTAGGLATRQERDRLKEHRCASLTQRTIIPAKPLEVAPIMTRRRRAVRDGCSEMCI